MAPKKKKPHAKLKPKVKSKPKQKKGKKKTTRKKTKAKPEIKRFEIPVDTLNRSRCLQQDRVTKMIGSGGFGQVYEACDAKTKECKYVLKIQFLLPAEPDQFYGPAILYLKEVFFHKYVQDNTNVAIVPKLYDNWTCTNTNFPEFKHEIGIGLGLMLLDKWDGSLFSIQTQLTNEEINAIGRQFQLWFPELVRLQIEHNDFFGRNILYRGRGPNMKIALTDWANTRINTNEKNVEEYWKEEFNGMIQALKSDNN